MNAARSLRYVNRLRIGCLLISMTAAFLGYGTSASAQTGPPDFSLTFPKGLACADFDLLIQGWDGKTHSKTFEDKKGVVRMIFAGTGSALRYTNVSTGATFSSKSNGAVNQVTYNLDGTVTQQATGHNVLFLFPTDFPPGPSTTLYDGGRFVVRVEPPPTNLFTVIAESGNKIDICAALSR